ncbi:MULTISPECIES: endonuclease/exonuclease/phosphatase family protein [Nocardioides]|uniref:Endonuclease/exonuclease/phosphatase family protein n=1 Tax=Nocardioides vastitatis TaxID=2568655 RepID=A0ABW0ZIW1_9ACTN|nr:endonuclease/exonuclease/phosphatase family protein [Nocardioides sp.]
MTAAPAGRHWRIGTWNLAGASTPAHKDVLDDMACDVLLLTEVRTDLTLDGYERHTTSALMGPTKYWSAIYSREPLELLPDPHPASAAARIGGVTMCASVMPWTLAAELWPWGPASHGERMRHTTDALASVLGSGPVVWGGDLNQPLTGNIAGFARAAQAVLIEELDRHGLQVPTRDLPGKNGQAAIDHIAAPRDWRVLDAGRIPVASLSDHDAYWVATVRKGFSGGFG